MREKKVERSLTRQGAYGADCVMIVWADIGNREGMWGFIKFSMVKSYDFFKE